MHNWERRVVSEDRVLGAGHGARSLPRIFPVVSEALQNPKKSINWSFVTFCLLPNILSKGMDISECICG